MIKVTAETFKIESKIVHIPKKQIPIKSLMISFNEMYKDYVVYYPGTVDMYITYIGDQTLGFGPRYLLKKILEQVEKANPDGTVDSGSIEVRTIPKLPEPLIRRLGQLNKKACDETKNTNASVEEEAKESINELGPKSNVHEDPEVVDTESKYK